MRSIERFTGRAGGELILLPAFGDAAATSLSVANALSAGIHTCGMNQRSFISAVRADEG